MQGTLSQQSTALAQLYWTGVGKFIYDEKAVTFNYKTSFNNYLQVKIQASHFDILTWIIWAVACDENILSNYVTS